MRTAYIILSMFLYVGTFAQKGIVVKQNSGNFPLSNARIKVRNAPLVNSDSEGKFELTFINSRPYQRIIVEDLGVNNFEIANEKEVYENWQISPYPEERFKIVLCPAGTIEKNTDTYSQIAFNCLRTSRNLCIEAIKKQLSDSKIDTITYKNQLKDLNDQYLREQNNLETFAEELARFNFDEALPIHRQAFEAFKQGDLIAAIGLLETVDIETEILKVKSNSFVVINPYVAQAMFQAQIYQLAFRFDDAEKSYKAPIKAGVNYYGNVSALAHFLAQQSNCKWYPIDKKKYEKSCLYNQLAFELAKEDEVLYAKSLSRTCSDYRVTNEYIYKNLIHRYRLLAIREPNTFKPYLAESYPKLITYYQRFDLKGFKTSKRIYKKTLKIYEQLNEIYPTKYDDKIAETNHFFGTLSFSDRKSEEQKIPLLKNIEFYERLAKENPRKYEPKLAQTFYSVSFLEKKDIEKQIKYREKAIKIYEGIFDSNPEKYSTPLLSLYQELFYTYQWEHQIDLGEKICFKALKVEEQLSKINPKEDETIHWYFSLAFLFENYDYAKTEMYYQKALDEYKQLNRYEPHKYDGNFCAIYKDLADLYTETQRFAEAETYLKKALEISKNDYTIMNNLGILYQKQAKYEQADTCYSKAKELYKESLKKPLTVFRYESSKKSSASITTLNLMGDLYRAMKKFDQSDSILQEALKVCKGMKNIEPRWWNVPLAETYNYLGNLYLDKQAYTSSKDYYEKAMAIYERIYKKHKQKELAYCNVLLNICVVNQNLKQRYTKESIEYLKMVESILEKFGEHSTAQKYRKQMNELKSYFSGVNK